MGPAWPKEGLVDIFIIDKLHRTPDITGHRIPPDTEHTALFLEHAFIHSGRVTTLNPDSLETKENLRKL